eukprot:SAG25_NODE_5250_length_685_cov_1.540309_1_plen_141_part_00
MDGLDDIAPLMYYTMLITSLPEDQRPTEDDFGPSLHANEDIIRRMLIAFTITPPADFTYHNVVALLDHTGLVSGLRGDALAPAWANMERVQAICRNSRSGFLGWRAARVITCIKRALLPCAVVGGGAWTYSRAVWSREDA